MSFEKLYTNLVENPFAEFYGTVNSVQRTSIRAYVPNASVGAICMVQAGNQEIPMEIVSLDPAGHVAMPLDDLGSVRLGDRVSLKESIANIPVGEALLGQVIDSMCVPYLGDKALDLKERIPLYGVNSNPMKRALIKKPIDLGVRAINGCFSCGLGQRQGIFAGSGVGKSVLLGMMARFTSADVVVIGLIGERGREVKEFIEKELGEAGLKKSVVVVETAEKSSVRRVRGAYVATAVAEFFRNRGANVLLLMDSLTRFAMAQREIGMAAGEPPTTKGYTPSVFNSISKMVERAGNWGDKGSITGLYTVLVEGDDLEDPVADNSRAILDGHIVLSRKLANRGQYPAIDVLQSVSRVMDAIVDPEHKKRARKLKELLARYQDNEDAIHYGMYAKGSDLNIDESIDKNMGILDFLKQDREERATFYDAKTGLENLFG